MRILTTNTTNNIIPLHPKQAPPWLKGRTVNESLFCQAFLNDHRLAYTDQAFFTPDGKLTDESRLRSQIFELLEPYINSGITSKINSILGVLQLKTRVDDLPPQPDRIHVQNGTLFLDGRFVEGRDEVVRSRFPVRYDPNAKSPRRFLQFWDELFWPEDIPTVQEYIGYCLIPSTKGQRMMIIKGSGGEGKSLLGTVLFGLFGENAKDGSISKIAENPFARADLENINLMIDDDMQLEALKQTHYVKSIVTSRGKMDLERKGQQSYQGYLYARILAFSNGDLLSLHDHSVGFLRRQLILTTKPKSPDRKDDPDLADKLCEELEGIFLWAFEGLQRLVNNGFRFIESNRVTSRIFAVAKAKGLIEDTPFQKILLRNKGKKAGHHKPLPDEEVDRIKRAIPFLSNERQRLYMGLLAYTGMRREEILGARWETINLKEGYGKIEKVVVYPKNRVAVVKDNPKTESSQRIFIIPKPLQDILAPCQLSEGFIIHGRTPEDPASHPTMKRTYEGAFKALGINGAFDNHDWRATYAVQLKDAGLTSAQGADLMGHADTRMFDTVYAPAREQGILKHKNTLEALNAAYVRDIVGTERALESVEK